VEGFLLFLLILINGLLAMSEVALLTSKRAKLQALAAKGKKSAEVALKISEDPTRFLSTIQIGITSIGLLSGIVGEAIFAQPLSLWIQTFGLAEGPSHIIATVVVVVVVTYVSIVVGELVPKRIGQQAPESIAAVMSRPMNALALATRPFVMVLTLTTNLILRVLGISRRNDNSITEAEIEAMLDEGSTTGLIEVQERELVRNVFRLDDRKLGSFMVPRNDIFFLDVNDPIELNIDRLSNSARARIPICDGDLDSILGILNARKALSALAKGEELDLKEGLEEPLFVPETLTGMDLLNSLKESRSHMAFVVDEYGSFEGLVTIQDLFDSLTGQIAARDEEVTGPVQREDGSWLLEGDTSIHELMDCLQLSELPQRKRENYHTISGLILLLMGKIPVAGESVVVESWRLEVVDMDGNRIDKVLASRISTETTQD
jgi:putative hemolysin